MFDGLGFGAPLKLGFPGEVGGRLRPAKTWRPIEQATMAYGHGISVTLIQLARAYQAFARDGDLLPLSLPGGLGGVEATMVGLLILIGSTQPLALAATVIIRLTTLWFAVALGLLALVAMLRIDQVPEQTSAR